MTSRKSARHGGIGLALAGGGPAGAVYEIGALYALQEALDGVDVTALQCYVGVSAGAFVAACLANRMPPSLLVQLLDRRVEGEVPFDPKLFFVPNYREFARRGLTLPGLFSQALWYLLKRPLDRSVASAATRTARALPAGIFDNEPIRKYLEEVFSREGRTNDFRKLETALVLVASELETGKSIRFGAPGHTQVPISLAVQASTALPGVYPPVLIDGRYCVDGVLLKTLHASVALEYGVELLLCVNPVVPVDTRRGEMEGVLKPGALLDGGLPAVLSQTFRTLVHSRLELGLAGYAARYPNASVVLFEPPRDEYGMFFSNILSLGDRHRVCDLAYRATRADLLRRADELEPLFARFGITLRRDILEDEARTLWASLGKPESTAAMKMTTEHDAFFGRRGAARGRRTARSRG
jgi:predicted acylesterase/phospholipase RssA